MYSNVQGVMAANAAAAAAAAAAGASPSMLVGSNLSSPSPGARGVGGVGVGGGGIAGGPGGMPHSPVMGGLPQSPTQVGLAPPPCNVYVSGIPLHWREADLAACFAPYGEVVLTKLLLDAQRNSRGAGFVHFGTHNAAIAAIRSLSGFLPPDASLDPHSGRPRVLQVKFAHEKGSPGDRSTNDHRRVDFTFHRRW
jgi:hypothetical protein